MQDFLLETQASPNIKHGELADILVKSTVNRRSIELHWHESAHISEKFAHDCRLALAQDFLLEIQASPNIEYGELADILVRQAQSTDEVTRMTALRWLRAFVIQAKDQLMPYYAVILAAVLPNVSHNNQDICQVKHALNCSEKQ